LVDINRIIAIIPTMYDLNVFFEMYRKEKLMATKESAIGNLSANSVGPKSFMERA
jgi:hypothetical protein